MIEWYAILAGSFLASAHCVGMCGGLAAAVGASQRKMAPIVARQLVYTSGRVFTYSFLGAICGYLGERAKDTTFIFADLQQIFSLIAGGIMIVVGLSVIGVFPRMSKDSPFAKLIASPFRYFINAQGWWGYFVAGLATGFLPCGLVYAFLALAVASASAANGMLIMAVFGIGTAPAMIAVGCGSAVVSRTMRDRVFKLAAVAMVIMGSVSIYRAWPGGESCCSPPTEEPVASVSLAN